MYIVGMDEGTTIGIDQGLKGGCAALTSQGTVVGLLPMPVIGNKIDTRRLKEWLIQKKAKFVSIEKAQSFKSDDRDSKMGRQSIYNYGFNSGVVVGVVAALDLPYALVPPKNWQKQMFAGVETKLPPKKRAEIAANRLYPGITFIPTGGRKAHDGCIDAVLIAEYTRRGFDNIANKIT